jgi:hypothetical protein
MCGWSFYPCPSQPYRADLIEAIIDCVTLLEPGLKASTPCPHLLCFRLSFPETHILHHRSRRPPTNGGRLCALPPPSCIEPYLGTHVRHLRLVDNTKDGFANGISWLTDLRTLGVLPNPRSFGLSFNSTGANWDGLPDKTRAAFTRVFKMENVEEVKW